jgi:hypothetical protein
VDRCSSIIRAACRSLRPVAHCYRRGARRGTSSLRPHYIRLWHVHHPDVGVRLQEFRHRILLEEAVGAGRGRAEP